MYGTASHHLPTAGFSLSPFLPFPFSQDHCFQGDPQNPARGAKDCYERICGNPRSNLHADDNGCISSLIPRFYSPPAISSSRVCATARSKEMQVAANVYQVVLHLHLSLKGIGIAVKLNIDKKSMSVLQCIETDACRHCVINAKPESIRDHAK